MDDSTPSELPDSMPFSSINQSEIGSSIDFTSEARGLNWIPDDEDLYSEGICESPLEKLRSILRTTQGNVGQCEDLINEIASLDDDLNTKCETIAVTNLLPRNSFLADAGNFSVISVGVDILVKYGINLLKPKKNPNWRSIKLSNGVFKSKVQPLQGYEDVLRELGYTEKNSASFDFLPSRQQPDIDKVAMVTADLLILQRELLQFRNGTHINKERFLKHFSSFQIRDLLGGKLSTAGEGIALEPISNQQSDPPKVVDASKENLKVKTPVPAPRRNVPPVSPREAKPPGQPQTSVKGAPTESPMSTVPLTSPLTDSDDIEIIPSVGVIKHPPSRMGGHGVHGSGENLLAKPNIFHAWQDPAGNVSAEGELAGPKATPRVPPRDPLSNPVKNQGSNASGLRTPADFTQYPVEGNSRPGKAPSEMTILRPPQVDRKNKPQAGFPLNPQPSHLSPQFVQPHPQVPASAAGFPRYSDGGNSSQKEPPEVPTKKPPVVDRRNKPQSGFPLNQQHPQLSPQFVQHHSQVHASAAGYHSPTGTPPSFPQKPGIATRSESGSSAMNQEPLHKLIGKSVGPPSNEYKPSFSQPQRQLPAGAQPTPFTAPYSNKSPVPGAAQPLQISGHVNNAGHVKQDTPSGMKQQGQRETPTSSGTQSTKTVASHPPVHLEDCAMCEGKPGIIHCDKCQSARCEACDRRWHSHPKRKAHQTRRLVPEEPVIEQQEVKTEVEEKKDEECFVCGEIATFQCITCPNFFCPNCDERFHRQKERQSHERFKLGVPKNTEPAFFLQDPSVTGAKPKTSSPVKAKTEEKKKPVLPAPTREEMLQRQHEEVVEKDIEVLEQIEIVAQRCSQTQDLGLEQQLMQEEKLLRNQHLHLMDELEKIDQELANIRNENRGDIQARGVGKRVDNVYHQPPPAMTAFREDRPHISQEGHMRDNVRQNTSQRQRRPVVLRKKWVCGHCTFRNENLDDKICGVCSKTTPDPEIVEEEEEVECKDEADIHHREAPRETEMYIQQEAEEETFQEAPEEFQEEDDPRKQKEQENLSYRLLLFYREAEGDGYTLEDVKTAWDIMEREEGELSMKPVEWLNQHLDAQLQMIAVAISKEFCRTYNMGNADQISDAFSVEEIHEAWWRNDGDRDNTAAECLELLHEKVEELHAAHKHLTKIEVAYALMESDFNLSQARWNLEEQSSQEDARKVQEWMNNMWDTATSTPKAIEAIEESQLQEQEKHEKIRRMLMAEHDIVWAAVDTVFSLRGEFELGECIEAVKAMGGTLHRARDYFKECDICLTDFGMHKLVTLPMCQCRVCTECFAEQFTLLAKSTPCMYRFTCPVCNEPDLENCDEDTYRDYFAFLGTMLRNYLEKKDYELYEGKLATWGLINDPKFRWCAHGCSAGFINERDQNKIQCPECKRYQCFDCKKQWLDQHDNISCEEFDAWKKNNDPEFQQQGLAAHLKENGINCPKCKMRYELAKGGCMHFKCTQCHFEFCCGCNLPFRSHPACNLLPSCKGKGLHAHHPRDCFYYLRDEDCQALQQLLQKHGVNYNQATNAVAAGDDGDRPQVCPVEEQQETPDGLVDAVCGKPLKDQCGLCENHYKEYLVDLINQHNIDPVDIFSVESLQVTLRRNNKQIPNRAGNEADAAYATRLRQEVQQQLPLRQRNAQGVQGVAAADNQI